MAEGAVFDSTGFQMPSFAPCDLLNMPYPCMRRILQFADFISVCRTSRTCRYLKEVIEREMKHMHRPIDRYEIILSTYNHSNAGERHLTISMRSWSGQSVHIHNGSVMEAEFKTESFSTRGFILTQLDVEMVGRISEAEFHHIIKIISQVPKAQICFLISDQSLANGGADRFGCATDKPEIIRKLAWEFNGLASKADEIKNRSMSNDELQAELAKQKDFAWNVLFERYITKTTVNKLWNSVENWISILRDITETWMECKFPHDTLIQLAFDRQQDNVRLAFSGLVTEMSKNPNVNITCSDTSLVVIEVAHNSKRYILGLIICIYVICVRVRVVRQGELPFSHN